jgi:hypothetical protein
MLAGYYCTVLKVVIVSVKFGARKTPREKSLCEHNGGMETANAIDCLRNVELTVNVAFLCAAQINSFHNYCSQ